MEDLPINESERIPEEDESTNFISNEQQQRKGISFDNYSIIDHLKDISVVTLPLLVPFWTRNIHLFINSVNLEHKNEVISISSVDTALFYIIYPLTAAILSLYASTASYTNILPTSSLNHSLFRQILLLGTTTVSILILLLSIFSSWLHQLVNEPTVLSQAKLYLHYSAVSYPLEFIFILFSCFLVIERKIKEAYFFSALFLFLSPFSCYLFVVKLNLSVTGAAFASSTSFFLFDAVLFFYIYTKILQPTSKSPYTLLQSFHLLLYPALSQYLLYSSFYLLSLLSYLIKDSDYVSFSLAEYSDSFMKVTLMTVQISSSITTGRLISQGKIDSTKRSIYLNCLSACLISVLAIALYFPLSRVLTESQTEDSILLSDTNKVKSTSTITQIPFFILGSLAGSFRACQLDTHTVYCLIISLYLLQVPTVTVLISFLAQTATAVLLSRALSSTVTVYLFSNRYFKLDFNSMKLQVISSIHRDNMKVESFSEFKV